jgi:hypothetical protein
MEQFQDCVYSGDDLLIALPEYTDASLTYRPSGSNPFSLSPFWHVKVKINIVEGPCRPHGTIQAVACQYRFCGGEVTINAVTGEVVEVINRY